MIKKGNNRVVVNQSGSVVQVNDYTPFGVSLYTPFTQTVNQRYKYNGKELDMMYIKLLVSDKSFN